MTDWSLNFVILYHQTIYFPWFNYTKNNNTKLLWLQLEWLFTTLINHKEVIRWGFFRLTEPVAMAVQVRHGYIDIIFWFVLFICFLLWVFYYSIFNFFKNAKLGFLFPNLISEIVAPTYLLIISTDSSYKKIIIPLTYD